MGQIMNLHFINSSIFRLITVSRLHQSRFTNCRFITVQRFNSSTTPNCPTFHFLIFRLPDSTLLNLKIKQLLIFDISLKMIANFYRSYSNRCTCKDQIAHFKCNKLRYIFYNMIHFKKHIG